MTHRDRVNLSTKDRDHHRGYVGIFIGHLDAPQAAQPEKASHDQNLTQCLTVGQAVEGIVQLAELDLVAH